jgi:amino acid transporter
MSDKQWKFSQPWVSVSLVLYIVIVGIAHAVVFPSYRKINSFLRSPSPPPAEIAALEKRIAAVSGVNSLMFVAVLFLMVVKPR